MTREEGLQFIGQSIKNDVDMAMVANAIEALSAECEDAISRQAALDAFNLSEKTRKYGGDHSGYDTMMLYEIQDVIEDLPSVTPKQNEVLDKIRAEIVEIWKNEPCAIEGGCLDDILQIIDKYREESEN